MCSLPMVLVFPFEHFPPLFVARNLNELAAIKISPSLTILFVSCEKNCRALDNSKIHRVRLRQCPCHALHAPIYDRLYVALFLHTYEHSTTFADFWTLNALEFVFLNVIISTGQVERKMQLFIRYYSCPKDPLYCIESDS